VDVPVTCLVGVNRMLAMKEKISNREKISEKGLGKGKQTIDSKPLTEDVQSIVSIQMYGGGRRVFHKLNLPKCPALNETCS